MVTRGMRGGRLRLAASVILLATGLGWFGMAVLAWNDSTGPKSSAAPWLIGGVVYALAAVGVMARARWARVLGLVLGVGSLATAIGTTVFLWDFVRVLGSSWGLLGVMSAVIAAFAYVVVVLAVRW
jgi:hypothetical protein